MQRTEELILWQTEALGMDKVVALKDELSYDTSGGNPRDLPSNESEKNDWLLYTSMCYTVNRPDSQMFSALEVQYNIHDNMIINAEGKYYRGSF